MKMPKYKDLTGQRFGRLVAIEPTEKRGAHGEIYRRCECDCGNYKEVNINHLRSGNTRSCGCLKIDTIIKDKRKKIEPGTVFRELTIIKELGSKKFNKGKEKKAVFLCKCSCGNEVEVTGTELRFGRRKSCGHLAKEGLKPLDKEMREKALAKRHKTDFVEKTSLSGISPNRKKAKGKTSEIIGVSKNKKTGLWVAQMVLKGEHVLQKSFKNKQDAINARKEAEEKYFKPILEKYGKEKVKTKAKK